MSEVTSLSLGENLDTPRAEKLLSRIKKSLEKGLNIELKADQVSFADTAGLQLILAMKKDLERQGLGIIWKKPSTDLIECARLLGMKEALDL